MRVSLPPLPHAGQTESGTGSSPRRAGYVRVSLLGVNDHHIERVTVQAGGSKGREVFVILDLKVLQELLGEVGVGVAYEDVVVSVEKGHALLDSAERLKVPRGFFIAFYGRAGGFFSGIT